MTQPDRRHLAQFSRLLDELMDLDEPGRERRLSEVEPRLAAPLRAALRTDASGFLSGTLMRGPLQPALVGQRIGPYCIEAPLGAGGSGSVWRARRVDGPGEPPVAIKLLHLSLLGQAAALRFRQERAILTRLAHPHIARLLDAGETPDGQPYLVLEHVDGLPIDQHCDARALSVAARLALAGQLMSALTHAHGHGVVHRDIKPGNVLVTRAGHVKLLDFGIAQWREGPACPQHPLTAEGRPVLTPGYAAPEQWRGLPATVATDVYAVGMLLHELLCGRSAGGQAIGASSAIRRLLHGEPPRMAGVLPAAAVAAARGTQPAALRRQLQGDLQRVVSTALRRRPAERYASIAALAADVQRCLRGEPVLARPDSWVDRWAGAMRRHCIGAVIALLDLGLGPDCS